MIPTKEHNQDWIGVCTGSWGARVSGPWLIKAMCVVYTGHFTVIK